MRLSARSQVAGMAAATTLLVLASATFVGGVSIGADFHPLEAIEIALMALLAGISLYTIRFADRGWSVRGPLIVATICFAAAAVIDPSGFHEPTSWWGRPDDISTLLSAAGAGLLLITVLRLAGAPLAVHVMLGLGFSLGVASLCMELLGFDPRLPTGAGLSEISSYAVCAAAMSLLAWTLPSALLRDGGKSQGPAGGARAAMTLALWKGLQSRPGRFVSIAWEESRWRLWHLRRPNASFADYYVRSIEHRLDSGKPHRTLGKRRWAKESFIAGEGACEAGQFRKRGRNYLADLFHLGLEPHHMVVDYGCGSLRVGQHLIRFLDPGRYIGLDLTDRFYSDGLELLEPGLVASKRPEFGVISETTIARGRSRCPDFVISISVMLHVPPAEIKEYWENLSRLMVPSSKLVVYCDVSDQGRRTMGKRWAYAMEDIEAIVRRVLPGTTLSSVSVPNGDNRDQPWERKLLIVTTGR